jgi:hypothetical protein
MKLTIKLLTKLFMFMWGVKRKKRSKEPRYFPNDNQYPVENFEVS